MRLSMVTFNLGGPRDHLSLQRHFQPEAVNFQSQEEEEEAWQAYGKLEAEVAQRVTQLGLDVLFLQEVGSGERPMIQALADDYEMVHLHSDVFDGLVALRRESFEGVENHSSMIAVTDRFSKDAAIAKATCKGNGKSYVFASAHVPGFDVQRLVPLELVEGDTYAAGLRQRIDGIRGVQLVFLGADMNAWPELGAKEEGNRRFELLMAGRGQLFRSYAPTEFNPREPELYERELDFIVEWIPNQGLLQRLGHRVAKCLFNGQGPGSSGQELLNLDQALGFDNSRWAWPVDMNFSDHKPLGFSVTLP